MKAGEKNLLSRWCQILWPIQSNEYKKIIPLLLMKFFISFSYGILTIMKEAAVVTAKGSGAEAIPVLKGWVVLPVALSVALLYSKLTNHFSRSALFYGIILFFMSFILIYGFLLYPNLSALSPDSSSEWLLEKLGHHNGHWVAVYRNWVQSIFFVFAELWGQVVIFLLFWGFVNQICNVNEAKRCYTLFVAGGDLAQIFAGPLVCYFTGKYVGELFGTAVQSLVCCILFCGAMILILHWILIKKVIRLDGQCSDSEKHNTPKEKMPQLSLRASIKFIFNSPLLRCIAVMVIAYGLTMNLTEVTWKANLKLAFPETSDYQSFMSTISSSVGICSLLTTLFLSGVVIRYFGWHFAAQLPPILIGFISLFFLSFFLKPDWGASVGAFFHMTPLAFIVALGAFQNIVAKIMKYAFFDATKEMAFIPLDQESKIKGKAAVDILGSRFGKSSASWIQLALIHIAGTGSIFSTTHYLVPIIFCAVICWIFSVYLLNKKIFSTQPSVST